LGEIKNLLQQPGYDIIAQFMIGYALPGKPIANLLFKIYGRISTVHALSFLADLKLGHYMKIPPRSVPASTDLRASYTRIEPELVRACAAAGRDGGRRRVGCWTTSRTSATWRRCTRTARGRAPSTASRFDASVIWGLIGPERLFGTHGLYRNLVWLFLAGAVLPVPVWLLSRAFPERKWIALVNVPVISYGFAGMPPATPTNIATWLVTGTIFNYFVFRYRMGWWQKYNYVLSAAERSWGCSSSSRSRTPTTSSSGGGRRSARPLPARLVPDRASPSRAALYSDFYADRPGCKICVVSHGMNQRRLTIPGRACLSLVYETVCSVAKTH
jgi:hypothetical protein